MNFSYLGKKYKMENPFAENHHFDKPDESVCNYYRSKGFEAAKRVEGRQSLLEPNLSFVLRHIIEDTKNEKKVQARAKEKLETEIEQKQSSILAISSKIVDLQNNITSLKNRFTNDKQNIHNEIKELNKSIEKIKIGIKDLKKSKERLDNNPGKISIIGRWSVATLVLLTLYLFVFYIYAIHGVFMREFEVGISSLGTSLFSATPMKDAWENGGFLGIGFVLLAPILLDKK